MRVEAHLLSVLHIDASTKVQIQCKSQYEVLYYCKSWYLTGTICQSGGPADQNTLCTHTQVGTLTTMPPPPLPSTPLVLSCAHLDRN